MNQSILGDYGWDGSRAFLSAGDHPRSPAVGPVFARFDQLNQGNEEWTYRISRYGDRLMGLEFHLPRPDPVVVPLLCCPIGLESVWGAFLWRELNEYLATPLDIQPFEVFANQSLCFLWTPSMGYDTRIVDATTIVVEPIHSVFRHGFVVSHIVFSDVFVKTKTVLKALWPVISFEQDSERRAWRRMPEISHEVPEMCFTDKDGVERPYTLLYSYGTAGLVKDTVVDGILIREYRGPPSLFD